VNSLPTTVTRQRRDCDLNPGPSVPESSTLTTRLPSHPLRDINASTIHTAIKLSLKSINTGVIRECISYFGFLSPSKIIEKKKIII